MRGVFAHRGNRRVGKRNYRELGRRRVHVRCEVVSKHYRTSHLRFTQASRLTMRAHWPQDHVDFESDLLQSVLRLTPS